MPRYGWMKVRTEVPIQVYEQSFFTNAQIMESKLSKLKPYEQPDKTFTQLVRLRSEYDRIIEAFLRMVKEIYNDVDEFEDITDTVFKLIKVNLTYYRYSRIDEIINDNKDSRSTPGSSGQAIPAHNVEILRSNMITLLYTILDSLHVANQQFQKEEDFEVDERIVYIAILAKRFENSIEYYRSAREKTSDGDDEFLDVVDETAEGGEKALEKLEEYQDEVQEVQETVEEVDQELENI